MSNLFLQVFWARFSCKCISSSCTGGVSLYLKLKKLNQGVAKNFPKYSKLMLCSLLLGSYIQILIGQWSGVQDIFSRLSLIYSGWFRARQSEIRTSFFRLSVRLQQKNKGVLGPDEWVPPVKAEEHIEDFYTVRVPCIYRTLLFQNLKLKHTYCQLKEVTLLPKTLGC